MRVTVTSKVIYSHASTVWSFVANGWTPGYLSVTFLPHTGLEFQTEPVFRKQCFKLLMHDVFFCSPFP